MKRTHAEKRVALQAARELCRSERLAWRQGAKHRRAELRAALRRELEAEKLALRETCHARKADVRKAGFEAEDEARKILEAERHFVAEMRGFEKSAKARLAKARTTRTERRQESDAEVIANIPTELRPVFQRVKGGIKPGLRKTRTEAFLEWAEAHPEEIARAQADAADRAVAALVREHAAHEKKMRAPSRYRRSASELARELAEVPF